ncbi:MAG: DUF1700 domain-containing protein [Clostridia bacterium]|nr:DUF1700 domain-containing protein [Clostridia bacterium]
MTKEGFLSALAARLSRLSETDRAASLAFYEEAIADRMEDGLTEAEAVAGIGTPEEIAAQILASLPPEALVSTDAPQPRKRSAGATVAWILTSPLWIAGLIVLFALVFVAYVVLWALVLCVYAVGVALAASGVVCLFVGVVQLCMGDPMRQVLLLLAAGLLSGGLAIFWFFACKGATVGAAKLSRLLARGVKQIFTGRRQTK